MANYYYFGASLPMLQFGVAAPISLEKFLQDAKRLLAEKDCKLVEKVLDLNDSSSSSNAVFNEWKLFCQNFCNESAVMRAAKFGKDAGSYIRGNRGGATSEILNTLAEASKAANPLEAEKIIAKMQWEHLEDLAKGHMFDVEYLIIYALKLKILERFEAIDSVRGQKNFDKYREQINEVTV